MSNSDNQKAEKMSTNHGEALMQKPISEHT